MKIQLNKVQGLSIIEDMQEALTEKGEGLYVAHFQIGFVTPQIADKAGVEKMLQALKALFEAAQEGRDYLLDLTVEQNSALGIRLARKAEELANATKQT